MIGQRLETAADPEVLAKAKHAIGVAETWVAMKRAYYIGTTLSLRKVWLSETDFPMTGCPIETMAVDDHMRLFINVEWVSSLSDEEVKTALVHEVNHVLRLHARRDQGRQSVTINGVPVWNIATDCEINSDLKHDQFIFSEGSIMPDMFGLDEGLTAETYYEHLLDQKNNESDDSVGDNQQDENAEKEKDDSSDSPSDNSPDVDDANDDQSEPDDGAADEDDETDNSNGDEDSGNESESTAADSAKDQAPADACSDGDITEIKSSETDENDASLGSCSCMVQSALQDVLDEIAERQGQEPMSKGDAEVLIRQAAHEIDKAAKLVGNVPGGLERWAAAYIAPQVDWKSVLRDQIRFAARTVTGTAEQTFARFSRRYYPGSDSVLLPSRRDYVPSVAVLVDTSGSMGQRDLEAAVTEVAGIIAVTGGHIDNIELWCCDSEAHGPLPIGSAKEMQLVGGGGTDMRIGLSAIQAQEDKPDIVVCMTDGYTPWPENDEVNYELVVLLIGENLEAAGVEEQLIPEKARVLTVSPADLRRKKNS